MEMDNTEAGEDIIEKVNTTMDWAFKLGYSDSKNVSIAAKALTKLGLMCHQEARYAANLYLDLKGLGSLGEKYIPLNDGEKVAAE